MLVTVEACLPLGREHLQLAERSAAGSAHPEVVDQSRARVEAAEPAK